MKISSILKQKRTWSIMLFYVLASIVCLVITIMLWLYIWYGPKVKICRR